jgi:hypothetical protein
MGTARHQARQHSALSKENWTKGVCALTQESEPCAAIGMDGNQMQVQFRYPATLARDLCLIRTQTIEEVVFPRAEFNI